MKELITIVINVYNDEKHIKKCIDSVINQTYSNLEIIIINDGSTDGTLSICNNYKDKRIKIINQKNKGLSLSRNVGIENANGKYIYFIDSDDFIESDTIEYLYNILKKNNVSIASCVPLDIYNYDFNIKQKKEKIKILSDKEMLKKIFLNQERAGTTWNKLFDKNLFDNIRFEDRIINDVVTTHKLVLKAKRIAYSNQIKYYYLKHQNSILAKKNEKHSIDLYKAIIERYKYIKNIYPKFYENEIGVMLTIITLSLHNKKDLNNFLNKEKAINVFNNLFSIKVLFKNIGIKNKVKILLFRINPSLCKELVKIYLNIKNL